MLAVNSLLSGALRAASNLTAPVRAYAARNTFIPHSRGVFAHETCPRGNQYKPNVKKRIDTYGLTTRLQSRGGQQMLWRKILKGKNGWVNFVPAP